jgi:hypothetical protein
LATFRELNSIANEIDYDLPQAAPVADHSLGHLGVGIAAEFAPSAG